MAMEKATPWSMCTAEEAYDRERHMELSEFEATENTFHLPPSRRIADATLCIKKYRRSAAGGGTASSFSQSSSESDEKPSNFRSLTELDDAVEHLLKSILCHQKSHHENMTPRPLSKTAAFVDDRLRAVQVDYVVGHSTTNNSTYEDFHFAHRFHSRMIRYNILIGYLMSEPHVSPSKFEHKFNAHALQSSFSNYFQLFTNHLNLVQSHNDYQSHLETLDEMMCYATILNVSSVLLKQEIMFNATSLCKRLPLFQDGSSFGLLSYANLYLNLKPSLSSTKDEEMFPKWKWAIEVALAADLGNFIRCLDLVIEKCDFILEKNHIQRESRWKCLVRCLLSPTLPTMRIGLLRWYNKSFGKGEKVSGADVSSIAFDIFQCFTFNPIINPLLWYVVNNCSSPDYYITNHPKKHSTFVNWLDFH